MPPRSGATAGSPAVPSQFKPSYGSRPTGTVQVLNRCAVRCPWRNQLPPGHHYRIRESTIRLQETYILFLPGPHTIWNKSWVLSVVVWQEPQEGSVPMNMYPQRLITVVRENERSVKPAARRL